MKLADLVGKLENENVPQKKHFANTEGSLLKLIQIAYERGLDEFNNSSINLSNTPFRILYPFAIRALASIHAHNRDINDWHDRTCSSYDKNPAFYEVFLSRLCETAADNVSFRLRGHMAQFGAYLNSEKKIRITGWLDVVGDYMHQGTLIVKTFDSVQLAGPRMSGGILTVEGDVNSAGYALSGGTIHINGRAREIGFLATGGKIFVNGVQQFPRLQ